MNALTVDQIFSAAEASDVKVNRHSGYMQCPAHRGDDLNCHVFKGKNGGAMAKCHSHGCTWPDIKAALRLDSPRGRAQPSQNRSEHAAGSKPSTRPRIVAIYDYKDVTGALRYQTVRKEPGKNGRTKDFYQRRPNGNDGWLNNLHGVDPLPYRLPELMASTDLVLVVEGEKDTDNLRALGFMATCNHGGAGKWTEAHARSLVGRDVAVIADNDEPGQAHAMRVAQSLQGAAQSIRLVTLPDLPEKGDVSDWLDQGGTADQLRALIKATVLWWPADAEDGAALLHDVAMFLGRFVAYPNESARIAHTLWLAHTHLMGAWDSSPRIAFLSPEPGSGKTRALEVSELLVPRPIEAINMSAAALFRKVADESGLPTILFDEVDTVFGSKRAAENNEDVRGLLNAGHRRGAKTLRCVTRGKEIDVVEFEAFCAVALAGLGDLPDTILSRSIVVRMRRRAPHECVEPFRRRLAVADGHALRDRLATWAKSIEHTIGKPWPQMPDGIQDRDADVWEGLISIADVAGGDWPQRVRAVALQLVAAATSSTPSLGIQILADLRIVFGDADALSSEIIVFRLNALAEAPWAEIAAGKPLNARGLARRLKEFGITSRTIRVGDTTPRGYRREDLYDAWTRYLPSDPKSATSATTATAIEIPSDHAGMKVADGSPASATATQHRNQYATQAPSNGANVAEVADVADFSTHRDGAPEMTITERMRQMSAGALTVAERATLNGTTAKPNGGLRCSCGNPLTERRPGVWRTECERCTERRLHEINPALATEIYGTSP